MLGTSHPMYCRPSDLGRIEREAMIVVVKAELQRRVLALTLANFQPEHVRHQVEPGFRVAGFETEETGVARLAIIESPVCGTVLQRPTPFFGGYETSSLRVRVRVSITTYIIAFVDFMKSATFATPMPPSPSVYSSGQSSAATESRCGRMGYRDGG